MNRNHKLVNMDLQRFAPETNTTTTADLAPAISVDFTTRLAENIRTLQEILGIVEMEPVPAGTTIKFYTETVTLADQVAEGEVIGLSKVDRKLAGTKELVLEKYRKKVTAESIQKFGQDRAINKTDSALVAEVRKQVKVDFFTNIESATGTADSGSTLQAALANVWGGMQHKFDDKDVTPIFFVSSDDVADYLGGQNPVVVQTQFGFKYIENFLGLGTTFINPGITKGAVYGTAVENINGAYVPATGGDLARAFNLTTDQSGLVGMTHTIDSETASIITLLFMGVIFYAEDLSGVIKSKIGETETTYTAVESPTGNPAQQGWYELVNGEYVLTEDTTVTSGKTYYVASV